MLQIEEELKNLYRADSIDKNLILEFYHPGQLQPYLIIDNHEQIVGESLEIDEALSSGENLEFGSCEAAQLRVTVHGVEQNLKNSEMMAYQVVAGIYPAADTYPGGDFYPSGYLMPLGRYVVSSADRKANYEERDVIAFDMMSKFDINVIDWYNSMSFPMTLRAFRASLCRYVGITEHVPDYLPNDGMLVDKTIDTAELIGRDVLIACEQVNGAFGHFDRNGILQHVVLEPNYSLVPALDLYPAEDLYPLLPGDMNQEIYDEHIEPYLIKSCQFEEYTVQSIEKVQIRQEEGDIGAIYGTGENCLTVEGNFLVFGKSSTELDQIAAGIYGMVSGRLYIPHNCEMKGLPYLEVGDSTYFDFQNSGIVTYIIKRTLKGIFALQDSVGATGEEIRRIESNVNTEIIQLKGKSAILKKNVEEVSATLTDLDKRTTAQFKITAEEIAAEVKRAQGAEGTLSSRLSIAAEQIQSEVTRAAQAEESLSSRITQQAGLIDMKVSKGSLSSELSLEPGQVRIAGNRLVVDSTNFKLDSSGNVSMTGSVTATSGYIGPWEIGDNGIIGDTGSSRSARIVGGHIEGSTMDVADGIFTVEDGYANSSPIVRIGGFMCSDEYGRSIFQSEDEMTGMSGDPSESGGLYLWAGYNGAGDYAFVVNNDDETRVRGALHVSGSIYLNGSKLTDPGTKPGGWSVGFAKDEWPYDWVQLTPSSWPSKTTYPQYEGAKYLWWYVNVHYEDGSDAGPDA